MLEKLIQDDIAAAKTPVLLLAFAGTDSSIAHHLFCHVCSVSCCLQQYSVFSVTDFVRHVDCSNTQHLFSHTFCSLAF